MCIRVSVYIYIYREREREFVPLCTYVDLFMYLDIYIYMSIRQYVYIYIHIYVLLFDCSSYIYAYGPPALFSPAAVMDIPGVTIRQLFRLHNLVACPPADRHSATAPDQCCALRLPRSVPDKLCL